MTRPADRSIRPSVALFALVMCGLLGTSVYVAVDKGRPSTREESDTPDVERATHVLEPVLDEQTPILVDRHVGSVRRAFAQAYAEVPPDEALALGDDPQVAAYRASEAAPFMPSGWVARLVSARGLSLPPGARCDARVLPVSTSSFSCVVRVMCGEQLVYPNPTLTAGYVHCGVEDGVPVRARDAAPTHVDGDPTIDFDLHARRLLVSDSNPEREVVLALDPRVRRVL
jgi:hypothetical protein